MSTGEQKPETPGERTRRTKPSRKQLVDLVLGPLPVELINRALKLELEPGLVIFNTNHQVHVSRKRPDDYARLLPHIAGVVAQPLDVGDDLLNQHGFEMIGRVQLLAEWVLIAVKMRPDASGACQLSTFYPLSIAKIQRRRERGYLTIVRP